MFQCFSFILFTFPLVFHMLPPLCIGFPLAFHCFCGFCTFSRIFMGFPRVFPRCSLSLLCYPLFFIVFLHFPYMHFFCSSSFSLHCMSVFFVWFPDFLHVHWFPFFPLLFIGVAGFKLLCFSWAKRFLHAVRSIVGLQYYLISSVMWDAVGRMLSDVALVMRFQIDPSKTTKRKESFCRYCHCRMCITPDQAG